MRQNNLGNITMKFSPVAKKILRAFTLLAFAVSAAMPVRAAADDSLGADNARHLLNRTGFAATETDIAVYAKLNRAEAADRLLTSARSVATQSPPAWVNRDPFKSRPYRTVVSARGSMPRLLATRTATARFPAAQTNRSCLCA